MIYLLPSESRFKTLTRNIRCRRGEKVAINLPVFQDDNTKDPHEILVEKYGAEAAKASKPGHIYMDAMGFGMGQSCLQVSIAKIFLETNCLLKIDSNLVLHFQHSNSSAMELLKRLHMMR